MSTTAVQLRQLYYSSPIEEESTRGWGKATIKYAIQNKKSIIKSIHRAIRNYNVVGLDAEDIFQSFILYLYNAPDYDISIAYNGERIIGIRNYVYICLKYCIKRIISNEYNHEKGIIRDTTITDDGEELSIFDTIPDESAEVSVRVSAEDIMKEIKCYQFLEYKYNINIFLIIYLRLKLKNNPEKLENMLELLVGKKSIERLAKDEDFLEFIQYLGELEEEDVIKVLEDMIPGSHILKRIANCG